MTRNYPKADRSPNLYFPFFLIYSFLFKLEYQDKYEDIQLYTLYTFI